MEEEAAAAVFTVPEVAEWLRVDTAVVDGLLNSGELAGFRVGGEWRILGAAIVDYLRRAMHEESTAALGRALADPKAWARELLEDPEFAAVIAQGDFEAESVDAMLQSGLRTLEAEDSATNVVELHPRDPE